MPEVWHEVLFRGEESENSCDDRKKGYPLVGTEAMEKTQDQSRYREGESFFRLTKTNSFH